MQLERYRSLWGYTHPLAAGLAQLKKFGYDGIEVFLPAIPDPAGLKPLLEQHSLKVIAQIITRGGVQNHSVAAHLEMLDLQLEQALALEPEFLNLQPGASEKSISLLQAYSSGRSSSVFRWPSRPTEVASPTHRGPRWVCSSASPN